MLIPVININLRQFLVPDYQQILSILFFRSFSKIKTSGYYSLPVNDYNLIVGDGVSEIYIGSNAHVTFRVGHQEAISNILKSWIPNIVILAPEEFKQSLLKDVKKWVKQQEYLL